MRTIRLPKTATRRGDIVYRIWFTPDNRQLVVLLGHEEGANALCWTDLAGETILESLSVGDDEHDCAVPSPEFSADHRYLAVPGDNNVSGEIAVLDRSRPKPARVVLEGPKGAVLYEQYGSVAFSPDGAFLIAARSTGTADQLWLIHRWATASALETSQERLRPVPQTALRFRHPCGPTSVAISPDGKYLATITYDGARVFRWEFPGGKVLPEIQLPSVTHRECTAYAQGLLFAPDSRTLAVAGSVLAVCDGASGLLRHRLSADAGVCGMAFHPDGGHLATVAGTDEVTLWDVATGKEAARHRFGVGALRAIAIASDGLAAVAGGEDGRLVHWEWAPREQE
jgi:WD40 repeat protein